MSIQANSEAETPTQRLLSPRAKSEDVELESSMDDEEKDTIMSPLLIKLTRLVVPFFFNITFICTCCFNYWSSSSIISEKINR